MTTHIIKTNATTTHYIECHYVTYVGTKKTRGKNARYMYPFFNTSWLIMRVIMVHKLFPYALCINNENCLVDCLTRPLYI
jgi:hypothetical protein